MRNRDIGSEFLTIKHEYESSFSRPLRLERPEPGGYTFGRAVFDGPARVMPLRSDRRTSSADAFTLGDQTLLGMGSTAIARVLPTNPIAGAAVFLGELREGVPSIIGSSLLKSRLRDYRKVGDEYLNVQFGWKPLVSDVLKFAEAAKTHEQVLQQYRRDSGRNVRRRYSFPTTIDTKTEVLDPISAGNSPWPASSNHYDASFFESSKAHRLTKTTVIKVDVWFSGCFTYYLDPGDDNLGKAKRFAQEANKISGSRITPEVLWNLAPWSWAVDWVTNVGDIIHNMSAFSSDGLVMRWGYLMEKTVHEVTYQVDGLVPKSGSCPSMLTETYRTTRKRRLAATPYGFGVDMGALKPSQYAILAALGISRAPRLAR